MRKMGTPLDKLSSRVDIVAELCRLSQGEPLLVKLYVDDLLSRGEQAARLLPEDLQTIQPKLDGYFDRWWDDQKKLWKKQGKDKTPKIVYEILYILAAALGPITQADIMKLANLDYIDELKDAVQDLSRFVMGDGVKQGYFFSHPKLSQHFWDTLKNADKHLVWEQRFLTWGQQTLQGLNNRTVSPGDEKSCRYPVRYYRRHLDRYDCHTRHERPIEPAMIENYLDLVSDGWRRGWEALEGGYGGF